jgi:hypothetical protein
MKSHWLGFAWALVGVPVAVYLLGLLPPVIPMGFDLIAGIFGPGLCLGSGVGVLLACLKRRDGTQVAVATIYGTVIYVWSLLVANSATYVATATVLVPSK